MESSFLLTPRQFPSFLQICWGTIPGTHKIGGNLFDSVFVPIISNAFHLWTFFNHDVPLPSLDRLCIFIELQRWSFHFPLTLKFWNLDVLGISIIDLSLLYNIVTLQQFMYLLQRFILST